MIEWRDYKLGEFAEIQTGPFGSQLHASDYVSIGTPSIMPTNIGNRLNIVTNGIVYVGEKDIERLKKYTVKEGDIVYSRRGDVEKCAYITKEQVGWLCGTGCLRIRFTSENVNSKFCAYYLSSPEIKSWVVNSAVGTTMPNLNSKILEALPLTIPDVTKQNEVAEILTSLDDKIDLLHRQNKTLEQLAETLFRQWFVEEAEESWEIVKLGSLGTIICGKTPSKKIPEYFDGEIPFIKIPDMHGKTFVFETEDSLTEEGLKSQSNKTLPQRSICVSCIATVGLVIMNATTAQTNQQINSIIPLRDAYRYFLYLKMRTMKDELLAMASGGTATDNLNTGDFSKIDIVLPPENLLKEFDITVYPLFEKIFTNQTQIRTLTQLRDTLLPKLISGEVRVK